MAPPSPIRFIETALSCTGPFAVSYTDPDQKWLIRKHLISLIQNFPNLSPSVDPFFHDNGCTVNLLNVRGYLHVSQSTPPIPINIWLHENYPFMAPLVFVSSDPTSPIHGNHPFVDSSGATASPYLIYWNHPHSNLSDFVHNLVKLFSHDHPFVYLPASSFTHPSLVSKQEALDRLAGRLHYDIAAIRAKTAEEIEELSALQGEMVKRVGIATSIVMGLDHEKKKLRRRVKELTDEADMLMNWVTFNDPKNVMAVTGEDRMEDVIEAADEKSELVLDQLAGDKAMEDLMYELDKAVEQGVVTLQAYIKEVRTTAREQFFNRAMLLKLKGPDILHWLH